MTGLAAREESEGEVGMEGGEEGVWGRGNMLVRVNKVLSTHTNTHTPRWAQASAQHPSKLLSLNYD